MNEPVLVVSESEWSVEEIFSDTYTETLTFDTEENAVTYWRENQPAVLKRTTTEYYATPEKKAEFDELQTSKEHDNA